MDVQFGHCWRCDMRIAQEVACGSCGVAKYCTETCRLSDQYRHRPECEEWGHKICYNPACRVSGQLKECFGCCNAWYCTKECQTLHWKCHQQNCQKIREEIKQGGEKLRNSFKSLSGNPLCSPYYIGNALAVDMLNLPGNECNEVLNSVEKDPTKQDYSILSAGCGNLRNWIHTVASLPEAFSGKLHTVLNDFDPFVQARNVLHLYMMTVYSHENEIATRITSIWYSLHLTKSDYKFLVECLTSLQTFTASTLYGVTSGVVQLTEADLSPMREVWQAWVDLECRKGRPNYVDLHMQRQRVFNSSPLAAKGIKLYKKELPKELLQDYDKYLASGDFMPSGQISLQYDNPTMTGWRVPCGPNDRNEFIKIMMSPHTLKFVYCINSDLTPFFAWDYLQVKRKHFNKSMVVMFHGYISDQIKQVITRLKTRLLTTSILIWNCLDLSTTRLIQVQCCKFDRIFTSNIADFSGTQPLLKVMQPLLNRDNKCATIVTQYWNWYNIFPSAYVHVSPPGAERDATLDSCIIAAVKDANSEVGDAMLNNPFFMNIEYQKTIEKSTFYMQEYFNYMIYFVNYLRAEFLAFTEPLESATSNRAQPPAFQKVKQSEGLRLRDFRRGELNKVVPFQYRRNVRQVNSKRGMERMLEWHWP